ncbi:DNA polymerase III subunit gamma/tau [Candidatus Uhrbacteria bacterium]|nr:DNA polymerase III subunit gamma/tau [Candidatus Uhrbacteria bacterium]
MNLYRKYRPQTFEGVSGQHHVVTPLRNQVKTDAVSHAYLFSGARGIGKTTLARILSKAVNCLDPKEGEPCGLCLSCETIQDGKALDIIEIDAASNTGVDNVRDNIIENVRFAPTSLKKKVFIVDEVHMLSKGAFNALLKTLEEPPAYVLFILATTELHKIPDTIVSRCQRYDFTKIPMDLMIDRLKMMASSEKVEVDEAVLYEIGRRSGGCLRDAEGLLGQVLTIGETKITLENASVVLPVVDISHVLGLVGAMVKRDAASGVRLINHVLDGGFDLVKLTDNAIDMARAVLLSRVGQTELQGDYTI